MSRDVADMGHALWWLTSQVWQEGNGLAVLTGAAA